jgi:hypothetical protein
LNICGAGSTLSEYELYFNYARAKYPETVKLRPLFWTNGPSPGLLFWPQPTYTLKSDGGKGQWMHHRQWQGKDSKSSRNDELNSLIHLLCVRLFVFAVPEILDKQMAADREQGYDYVGYHAYAKRRYSEMVGEDLNFLCANVSVPHNSTCSWREYDEYETAWRKKHNIPESKDEKKGGEGEFTKIPAPGMRNISDYFRGCACWMAKHQSGP